MNEKEYEALAWAVEQAETLKGLYCGEERREFLDMVEKAKDALLTLRLKYMQR